MCISTECRASGGWAGDRGMRRGAGTDSCVRRRRKPCSVRAGNSPGSAARGRGWRGCRQAPRCDPVRGIHRWALAVRGARGRGADCGRRRDCSQRSDFGGEFAKGIVALRKDRDSSPQSPMATRRASFLQGGGGQWPVLAFAGSEVHVGSRVAQPSPASRRVRA